MAPQSGRDAAHLGRIGSFLSRTHDGRRDLYDAFGYKRELTVADYYGAFERGALAIRIVRAFPAATWRIRPRGTPFSPTAGKPVVEGGL
ncbi:MAG: hypothetical protein EKK41_15750 [Hyphomicrobiales bacterium]|nr:MAG: hypothetical protein EKK41_15750 [Hyphomicrobiales bacterium]